MSTLPSCSLGRVVGVDVWSVVVVESLLAMFSLLLLLLLVVVVVVVWLVVVVVVRYARVGRGIVRSIS